MQGSADSGRATGGPNCSPFDSHHPEFEPMPVYEFEVPNTLVGLIIGVQGKTISVCFFPLFNAFMRDILGTL